MTQPITGYSIGLQRQVNNLSADNTVIPGREITVQDIATGNTLKVFVPNTDYTPEKVQQIIERELTKERAIHNLGGE